MVFGQVGQQGHSNTAPNLERGRGDDCEREPGTHHPLG